MEEQIQILRLCCALCLIWGHQAHSSASSPPISLSGVFVACQLSHYRLHHALSPKRMPSIGVFRSDDWKHLVQIKENLKFPPSVTVQMRAFKHMLLKKGNYDMPSNPTVSQSSARIAWAGSNGTCSFFLLWHPSSSLPLPLSVRFERTGSSNSIPPSAVPTG